MPRVHKDVNFSDDRGTIRDLLLDVDGVTEIFTRAGSVRGNHTHFHTTQWVYVVSGKMHVRCQTWAVDGEAILDETLTAGDLAVEPPGQAHAWMAIEDTLCLVFTKGPRTGKGYEGDTVRLREPLL